MTLPSWYQRAIKNNRIKQVVCVLMAPLVYSSILYDAVRNAWDEFADTLDRQGGDANYFYKTLARDPDAAMTLLAGSGRRLPRGKIV